MDMRKLVGRNAARLRDQAGLTQEQLAVRAGMSRQYISDLERGKLNPTQRLLSDHPELVEGRAGDGAGGWAGGAGEAGLKGQPEECSMPYRITGLGLDVVEVFQATLVGAARMASKMADQGVTEVRVFDDEGREVPEAEWDQAWWDSFRSS